MLEDLTAESFAARIGQRFELEDEQARSSELVLTECDRLSTGGVRRVPFSLVFRGAVNPVLAQRIYALRHAELGTLELFLVPIGQDGSGTFYQAIFT